MHFVPQFLFCSREGAVCKIMQTAMTIVYALTLLRPVRPQALKYVHVRITQSNAL